jgi:hypothetical protein
MPIRSRNYTVHRVTACRNEVIGSLVGSNSCAKKPSNSDLQFVQFVPSRDTASMDSEARIRPFRFLRWPLVVVLAVRAER